MSLEKTLSRLEARARLKVAKVDPVKAQAAREDVLSHLLTADKWQAEKARYAALTPEEQLIETRERLEAARAAYREELAPQRVQSLKGCLRDPGCAWFSVRALEIQLAALIGASASEVAGMAERATYLIRTGAWEAVAHLSAAEDWHAWQTRTRLGAVVSSANLEPVVSERIACPEPAPSIPHLNPQPSQPEQILPSFEPGEWN